MTKFSAVHVGVLAGACSEARRETFTRDEKLLVDDAKYMRFRDFWRAVSYWEQLADPDDVEDEADDERSKRELHYSESFRGLCVFVDYETFAGRICELANGTVVTPGSVVDWLDAAWIERVVFDGPSRVIDVGVRRRLFTGGTRRAVQVRDRQCFHEFCELPAEDCQVDHVVPYAAGGTTTQDNGRPACGFHNRERHRRP